jgi:hypothetical protein
MKLNMPRRSKIIFIIIYAACFFEFFAFGVRPTNTNGLLLLLCSFLFFCICIWSVIAVFTKWKTSRYWAITPMTACLLMLPIEGLIGRLVRDELFKWRFPRYEALVQKIELGGIPISTEGQIIPATNYNSSLAYRVWAQRDPNGILFVEFDYGHAGPPPYHQDYVYISSGVIEPGSYLDKRWPSKAKILNKEFKGKWFEVAD